MLSTSQNTVLPLEPNTNTITNNSFNAAPGALNGDLLSPVQTRLQAIASSDDLFTRVFGEKANTAEIQAIRSQWAVGDFSIFPKLQILDAAVLGGAFGAYSQTNQTIYLSDALLANGADDCMFGATGVLIEETFHWLDSLVGDDTPGDEGELARHLAFGVNPNEADLSRISQEQDQGLLWLNGQAKSVELSSDFAGNTFATARNITLGSTPTTFTDWVGSTDTLDYYRFTLTQTSTVNLSLTGLSADAQLGLLDANGRWLAWDWRTGTASESITQELNAGTYFIEVRQGSGSTHYNLTASATALPTDLAGNTFGTARNITLGTTPTTFTDWVGSRDTLDYYRFTLNQASVVNLSLTGLSADAQLGLLDANGRWLAWDWRTGTASESITQELNAGTYFIEVRQGSGSTHYNLTASATALPTDLAGNTFGTARNITLGTTPTTFTDWVGSRDTLDYYRFTLNQASVVNLSLTGLSADAQLGLLDANGRWLAWDWRTGTASESITQELNAGTYFIEVRQGSGSTHYNLTASATALPTDLAGNTFGTARNITLGTTPTTFTDWVGSRDTLDYYRFTLNQASVVNLSLTGLSADAQLGLLDANGRWLAWDWRTGTASESITRELNAGTYFIEVRQGSGSTHYNLNASATPILPVVTIQATDAEAAETNLGQTPNPGRFTLTRTGSTTHALTVNYSIGGTAIGGTGSNADYTIGGTSTSVNFTNRMGTVTFAAGASTAFIDINPINDSEFEDPETVILTLVNNSNYLVGTSNRATVTILDNDLPTVTIQATDAEAAETNLGQTPNPGRFTLTRTGSTTNALTVNYSIGGTATNGSDFNNLTGTVTFAAGASTVDILVNPIDDTLVEPSETVILTLLGSSTYQIGTSNTATVTILDNDVFPGDWFSQNLRDERLITTTRELALDGILCRNDMISIFRDVQDGGVIDATEFNDLRTIVENATHFNMPDYVRVLSRKVVIGDQANKRFNIWQPSATDPNTLNFVEDVPLGDLAEGASDTHMERLIGKWFLGQDRPTAHAGATMQLRLAQGSLFGTDNQISYADIDQGTLGDCYFLAALGSVAHQQPNTIRNMFIDNGDWTFTVRLYAQRNGQVGDVDYVTVDRFLPFNVSFWKNGRYHTNQRYAAHDNGTLGIWVALAEKAYAQIAQSGRIQQPEIGGASTNTYENIVGGWGYRALPSITGTNGQYFSDIYAEYDNTDDPRSGIFPSISQISTWLASGKAVTAGTIPDPNPNDNWVPTTQGIVPSHEYVILGVNAVTNTLTLYNPWGSTPLPGELGHGDINGMRNISYADFKFNFNMVSVA
ncbi:pre-peptidase C-terminal domain-containing protein [Gloeomargaritales cyanobacterium VI4D9]|nr:pre-peptidase C-terminal domain-containing protein [Gloeomargaritales cyanobacterium VI4D9]